MPPREAQIVGAVVVAELSQRENALPSEIAVDVVEFEGSGRARVEATQRLPGMRVSERVNYVCEVSWKQGRWSVDTVAEKEQ
ncbi:MAG TPA: hypothetical protein VFQ91_24400 [Bryobacteraceae bacterium]|nr:hypothetical protein [Bryobacteraceae bacterium]